MATNVQRANRDIARFTARLNRELTDMRTKRTPAGLIALGQVLLRRSNSRVPREYSNLFASGYSRLAQNNRNAVEVGYSAHYAPHVHEAIEMKLRGQPRPSGKGVYWGPRGEAQFLLKAVVETSADGADIVRQFAGVKPGKAR